MSLITFFHSAALANNSKTMFNNSGDSGYPFLIPDLSGNV